MNPLSRAAVPCTALLFVASLCLALWLHPHLETLHARNPRHDDLLTSLLGDGRKLFANHFFIKADKYFHSGYYPTIFDDQTAFHTPHMALYADVVDQDKNARKAEAKRNPVKSELLVDDESGSPGRGRDWIDRFGQHFYPVRHTHLDQSGKPGEMRELLPWLKLSVQMDPHRVETYVVTAYWLRRELNKTAEAEQFLRDGLRANPDSPEIYFELGRIQAEHHKDIDRARTLWELGRKKWDKTEAGLAEPNFFIAAQLLTRLAKLEEEHGDPARAIQHLQALTAFSPNTESVRLWIVELWEKLEAQEAAHPLDSPAA
jgi:tetratricopeptide (TPR) repeat protein